LVKGWVRAVWGLGKEKDWEKAEVKGLGQRAWGC